VKEAQAYVDASILPEKGTARFGYIFFLPGGETEGKVEESMYIEAWGTEDFEVIALLMALRRAEKLLEQGIVDKVTIFSDNTGAIKKCSPLAPPGVEIEWISSSSNKAHQWVKHGKIPHQQ